MIMKWIAFVTIILVSNVALAAFKAYETSPGIIELRAGRDQGLIVTKAQTRVVGKAKKKWLYFCVKENAFKGQKIKTNAEKCFYGSPRQFRNVKVGERFVSIEYGLKNRVYNSKGLIAIGAERYFYPVYVLYSLN